MIENSECENLTGVELHWKLNFDDNIPDIYKKTKWKIKCISQNCTIYKIIQKTYTNERLF